MAKKLIYLDYAAATPIDDVVFSAMQPYFQENFYNPSAPYQPAREVRASIESARSTVARCIGAKPTDIIFTAGATESINLALTIPGHAITCSTEHPAVLQNLLHRSSDDLSIIDVDSSGRVDIEAIRGAICERTTLITIALVQNETGTIQDIKALSDYVKNERLKRAKTGNSHPLFLHTDASQAAGIVDINIARLGVDMMTLNGGKIYGPKQTGILYASHSVPLVPIVIGGGQENGLRSGTENVAGIIGFAKALELAESRRKKESKKLHDIRSYVVDILRDQHHDIEIISPKKHSTPNILSISWPGLDAERLLFALEEKGVLVATGSACAANKASRSHVLKALGLPNDVIDGSLRLSFGRATTETEITQAVKIISMVVKKELGRAKKIS